MTKTRTSRRPLGRFSASSQTLALVVAGLALPPSPNTTSSKPVSHSLHSFNFPFLHPHSSSFFSAVASGTNSKPLSDDVTADPIDLDSEQGTDHPCTNSFVLLPVPDYRLCAFFLIFRVIQKKK